MTEHQADYTQMTDDEFNDILSQIVFDNASTLMDVPGVYEAVSEYFNNAVLDEWASQNPEKAWPNEEPEEDE